MFFWKTKFVQEKIVGDFTPKQISEILAKNQGLYNGFLAAGLIWGLFISQKVPQVEPSSIVIFFLICVAIAGIFGSITLKRPTAFLIQSIPAILALFLLWYPHF
jgi:putative membrane protein